MKSNDCLEELRVLANVPLPCNFFSCCFVAKAEAADDVIGDDVIGGVDGVGGGVGGKQGEEGGEVSTCGDAGDAGQESAEQEAWRLM